MSQLQALLSEAQESVHTVQAEVVGLQLEKEAVARRLAVLEDQSASTKRSEVLAEIGAAHLRARKYQSDIERREQALHGLETQIKRLKTRPFAPPSEVEDPLRGGYEVFKKGLNLMTAEELATTLAMFEHVTPIRLAFDQGKKGLGWTVHEIGRVSGSEGFKSLGRQFDGMIKLNEMIEETAQRFAQRPRARLAGVIGQQFTNRLKLEESGGLDAWYRSLLEQIAAEFKVPATGVSTPDLNRTVFNALTMDLLNTSKKDLEKSSPEERHRIVEELEQRLQRMTPEEYKEIQEALGVERLSGQTLIAFTQAGGATVATLAAGNAAGFGLYLAATTITHAVATTLLGLTLSFGFYTGLSSTLAFLLNPVFGAAMAVGVGVFAGSRLTRPLHVRVCATALLQVLSANYRTAPAEVTA